MQGREFDATVADEQGKVRVWLPFDATEVWGRRARHYVRGTINGEEFDGSLGTRGGAWFFPVSKQLRQRAAVGPGDQVRVVLEPADSPDAAVPPDLTAALADDREAAAFFAGLSGFYQRTWVGWVQEAAKPETRAARVADTVAALRAGRKQR